MPALHNAKHEEFARLIASGTMTAAKCYLAAVSENCASEGQAARHASRLRKTMRVKARIEELIEQRLKHSGHGRAVKRAEARAMERVSLNKEFVIRGLLEVVERCMQHEILRDKDGHPIMVETASGESAVACTFKAKEATRAYELLGKEMGMFVERSEHTLKLEERLAAMSEEERIKDAEELADRVRRRLTEARQAGEIIEGEARDITDLDPDEPPGGIGRP